ncbi:hypothetical protein PRZ48_014625 [Zasmidium cellare]|uniref:Uncharacterized protein n=1 Tax=Zasmidium cellare TaxID=395010 RepID=A0ABR0DYV9_ZASCE|nr:hypothetical protein PRZ48_014625 [Zasmidium cellare]
MSAATPRQRLGRLFNRRDVSNATSEPATRGPPPSGETREGRHVRHKSSLRSLRELVQNTSRSLSRTRKPLKRGPSYDNPDNEAQEVPVPKLPAYAQDSLPQIAHQTDLASDLAHLVLSDTKETRPRIDSVADQPVLRRKVRKLSHDDRHSSTRASAGHAVHIDTMMEPTGDPYSEFVADWNMARNDTPLLGALDDLPAPLRVTKSRSSDLSTGSHGSRCMPGQLTHKPHVQDLRRSIDKTNNHHEGRRRSSGTRGRTIRRSSLEKPLPELPLPLQLLHRDEAYDSGIDSELGKERSYLVRASEVPIDLKGVVDLDDTEDTHVETNWAPAVTHEDRTVNTHEIIQHAITREIHNHHIFHRILPIVDVEVLPARHFVPTEGGGLEEITAADAPVDSTERLQQLISEAVASMLPKTEEQDVPRHFSARTFEDTDCAFKEYTSPEGIKRTEQWWVHPPSVDTGAKEAGQTAPFPMNSENPVDDGLRDLPSDAVASTMSSTQPHASHLSWGGVSSRNVSPAPLAVPTHHTTVPIKMTHGGAAAQQVY